MENPQSYVHKPLDLRQTTKYSIVEVDAIVARCKELEQLLLQQKEELDAARAELLVSREDYESLDFYTRGIKSEREKLKSYSSNLRAENHDLLLHREETNTINGDLQDEIAGQKRALATLGVKSNAAHARIATLQAETTNYGIEKKSMESEIKKMKPFYELGVSGMVHHLIPFYRSYLRLLASAIHLWITDLLLTVDSPQTILRAR